MEIVLTESQFNSLLLEERMEQLLRGAINESKNINDLKKTIKRCLGAGVAVATIISAISKSGLPNEEKQMLTDLVTNTEMVKVDSTFQKKVDACANYMAYALKNQGYSTASTELKPETLVQVAQDSQFDLPFLMAVAHQESCFGASHMAKKTGSVFSEGLWSDGTVHTTYSDPNDSVQGYINLLNNHYLVDGKTIFNLMEPGKFVNEIGKRYAKDPKYEGKIKSLRNKIIKMYPELA